MPILYSLVARGSTVLAAKAATGGNFEKIAQNILEKIPASNSKMSYVYDRCVSREELDRSNSAHPLTVRITSTRAEPSGCRHLFHYIAENGLVFMCMADEEFGRRVPFAFLEDISKRFKTAYGERARTAMAYAFDDDFKPVLARQMVRIGRRRRAPEGPAALITAPACRRVGRASHRSTTRTRRATSSMRSRARSTPCAMLWSRTSVCCRPPPPPAVPPRAPAAANHVAGARPPAIARSRAHREGAGAR